MKLKDILIEHKQGYYRPGQLDKGNIHFIRISDITDHAFLDEGSTPMVGVDSEVINSFGVKKNDFLFARTGGAGRFCLVKDNIKGIFASYLIRFRFNRNNNPYFLRYYFLSDSFQNELKSKIHGGVNQNVHAEDIKDCSVPEILLSEQNKITEILDKVFDLIDKAKAKLERNAQNAGELFEVQLNCAYQNKTKDWVRESLADVCSISSKLIDPKKPEFCNLIHVGAGNIESKTGELSQLKTAKDENLISGKFLFDESMILYSKIRPYLMKVARCQFKGMCSADIYPLEPDGSRLTKDFLYYLLLTSDFTEYAIQGSQRAGMPKVNRDHLFQYKVAIPPLKTQRLIVKELDALRRESHRLQTIYEKKLRSLEELKKSILQKAFSGELTATKTLSI